MVGYMAGLSVDKRLHLTEAEPINSLVARWVH